MSDFASRRSTFADRESKLRNDSRAGRMTEVRKTKGLFGGPTLATASSGATYLDSISISKSRPEAGNAPIEESGALRQYDEKTLPLVERAEFLCEMLEDAIGRADLSGISLAVDLSTKVLDEIGLTRESNTNISSSTVEQHAPGTAMLAFYDTISREKQLAELTLAAATDVRDPRFKGRVEAYAFSEAHDALVCVVAANNGDRQFYPALKLDDLPRVGATITVFWQPNNDAGTIDQHGNELDTSRQRRPKGI